MTSLSGSSKSQGASEQYGGKISEVSPLTGIEMAGDKQHNKLFIFLSVFLLVEFAFTMFINAMAGGVLSELGWFKNGTGDISDYYYLEITPIGWTFSIWGIIYTWMILWMIYVVTSVCRTNKSGPVYLNPPIVNTLFLALATVNLALNITWLFLWDRQLMPGAFVVIFLYSCTMYAMLAISHRLVNRYLASLKKKHRKDLYLNRILIQNGVAFNATWVTIATLLNLAVVVAYWGDVDQSTASTISLSVLTCEAIVYFVLENFILERYLRHTYSVWPVIIWALSGSIAQNWDSDNTNSIFTAVLLALSCTLYLIKIGLSIWRSLTKPLTGPRF